MRETRGVLAQAAMSFMAAAYALKAGTPYLALAPLSLVAVGVEMALVAGLPGWWS
jgi:hypothetical protein